MCPDLSHLETARFVFPLVCGVAGSDEFSFIADHIRTYPLTPRCPGSQRRARKEAKEMEEVITETQANPFPKAHSQEAAPFLDPQSLKHG